MGDYKTIRVRLETANEIGRLQKDWILVDKRFKSKGELIDELIRCYRYGTGK